MATRFLRPCGAAGTAACAGAAAGAGAAGFAWAVDAGAATRRLKAKTRADHTSFFMMDLTFGTLFFKRQNTAKWDECYWPAVAGVNLLVSALLRLYNVEQSDIPETQRGAPERPSFANKYCSSSTLP